MKKFGIKKKVNTNFKAKPAIVILAIAIIGFIAVLVYSNINKPETNTDALGAEQVAQQTTAAIEPQEPAVIKPEIQTATETATITPIAPIAPKQDASADTAPTKSAVIAASIQEGQPKADINPTPPPKPATKDNATDKNKKPTYTEPETKPQQSEPQMGDKNDKGQIYIDGFGWVKDDGGGGKGTSVGNEGDQLTGHKVGMMD